MGRFGNFPFRKEEFWRVTDADPFSLRRLRSHADPFLLKGVRSDEVEMHPARHVALSIAPLNGGKAVCYSAWLTKVDNVERLQCAEEG